MTDPIWNLQATSLKDSLDCFDHDKEVKSQIPVIYIGQIHFTPFVKFYTVSFRFYLPETLQIVFD